MPIRKVLRELVDSGEFTSSTVQDNLQIDKTTTKNHNGNDNDDDNDNEDSTEENDPDTAQEWLDTLLENTNEYEYLEGKTQAIFQSEIDNLLYSLGEYYYKKHRESLNTFRWVDRICDLRIGATYRWLKRDSPNRLATQGKLIQIFFTENHTILHGLFLFQKRKRIIGYSMANYYVFQKMSAEESMILYANEMCLSSTSS